MRTEAGGNHCPLLLGLDFDDGQPHLEPWAEKERDNSRGYKPLYRRKYRSLDSAGNLEHPTKSLPVPVPRTSYWYRKLCDPNVPILQLGAENLRWIRYLWRQSDTNEKLSLTAFAIACACAFAFIEYLSQSQSGHSH